jgi:hypothetical protein
MHVAKLLRNNVQLTHCDLSSNDMTATVCVVLSLPSFSHRSFAFVASPPNAQGFAAIFNAIAQSEATHHHNRMSSSLSPTTHTAPTASTSSAAAGGGGPVVPGLALLDLSSTSAKGNMYIGAGLKGVKALRSLLSGSRALKELNVSNVGLGLIPDALSIVCGGLRANSALTTLDLSGLCLSLVRALPYINKSLSLSLSRSVCCSGNSLGHKEAAVLCSTLRAAYQAQTLVLE